MANQITEMAADILVGEEDAFAALPYTDEISNWNIATTLARLVGGILSRFCPPIMKILASGTTKGRAYCTMGPLLAVDREIKHVCSDPRRTWGKCPVSTKMRNV